MRLFLTGATGFVGLNFLIEVLRRGRYEEIVAAVRDPDKLRRQLAHEGVEPAGVRTIDWRDPVPGKVDDAVHCAGVLFARDRDAYFRVNVEDTLRLLRPLPHSARVLVLSSQSAGGPTPSGRERRLATDLDAPITWYGESKREMESRVLSALPGVQIWRPPMILGPRDRATLPLFRMAAGPLQLKPGLSPKTYSWIAVQDLVTSMLNALDAPVWNAIGPGPLAVAAPSSITDVDLLTAAGEVMGRRGRMLRIPHSVLRGLSKVVDAVPALRRSTPSLTRDRVREIFAERWVVDGSAFREAFGPPQFASLRETLAETRAWYVDAGLLTAA